MVSTPLFILLLSAAAYTVADCKCNFFHDKYTIISASLFIKQALICRSFCLSVWKVYCGKMTEWIQMPLGW